MKKAPYITVKSNFHGGGIHSRHQTLYRAAERQKSWKSNPGLIIGELGADGRYYRTDVIWNCGDYTLDSQWSDAPIRTRFEIPFPSARDYFLEGEEI